MEREDLPASGDRVHDLRRPEHRQAAVLEARCGARERQVVVGDLQLAEARGSVEGEGLVEADGLRDLEEDGAHELLRGELGEDGVPAVLGLELALCPSCGGRMRLLALVTDPKSVARFMRHLGEPLEPPARAPARDPPFWQSRVLRRRHERHAEQAAQLGLFEEH